MMGATSEVQFDGRWGDADVKAYPQWELTPRPIGLNVGLPRGATAYVDLTVEDAERLAAELTAAVAGVRHLDTAAEQYFKEADDERMGLVPDCPQHPGSRPADDRRRGCRFTDARVDGGRGCRRHNG